MSSISGDRDYSQVPDVFMVYPEFYDVTSEINPRMNENTNVDSEEAERQFLELFKAYSEALGLDVHVYIPDDDPGRRFDDMVFTANHGFVFSDEHGDLKVLPSRMAHEERAGEVEEFIEEIERFDDLEVLDPPDSRFEGSGDAMSHPEEKKIWVGYGQRTEKKALEEIEDVTGMEAVGLELQKEDFYHLDTCFEHLDEEVAMFYPEAFNEEGQRKIRNAYEDTIEVSREDAYLRMACNAHCPDGENVIINSRTLREHSEDGEIHFNKDYPEEYEFLDKLRNLEGRNFNVIEVDTTEYLKSAGSVYCVKLMLK